ncbi:methyltransferase NorI [Streptomyces albus]|uniref:Methyltransferase NorI n=1 Tax=Streptomyces albus (strain ATCC 21838 / DSM 41398 / FERM P-419 / JCM 4703 / NBRC 107858) TaxID=1081613 RepID=A0A0B5F225_STRA4|nr:methyltransferase NorI [Streptomyces albus]AOU78660.1 methyltransferase NorI [Streptomyces albus]AYN34401.1 class I SAM-dependent methyltransferase [Streptomyces albus]
MSAEVAEDEVEGSDGVTEAPVNAAAAVRVNLADYNPWTLRAYDATVATTCRMFWGCPRPELLALYGRNIGARHLDIGVGSGYLLDRCRGADGPRAVTLFDLNPNCLAYTAKRLDRYEVATARGTVLEPFPLPAASFDSAALNLMLHCVPGDLAAKGAALGHAAACVRPGGRLFGSTVLSRGVPVPPQARALLWLLNRRGSFHNAEDGLDALHAQLSSRFTDYKVTVRGCTAMFEATVE